MKVTTELKCGFGVIFDRHTPIYMEDGARKLFALMDMCHHDFKVSTYAQLTAALEEGETLATLKASDIYEILNSDNHSRALATILKEVIKEQEGIDLTVSDDFNDSDNVVLAVENEKMPLGLAINDYKNRITTALRQYMGMLWNQVPYPFYVSWAEKVQVPDFSREFFVDTPLGKIRVKAKYDKDVAEDYPGIYVDLIAENGEETPLACVEYTPNDNTIAVDVYHDGENPNMVERTYCTDLPGADLVEAKQVINEFVRENYHDEAANFSDLNKVPIAWTEYEEEGYSVNVYADLVDFAIVTYVTPWGGEPVWVSSSTHDSLRDLIDNELTFLDADNYVCITEQEWAVFAKDPGVQKWLAEKFPVGSRILIPSYVGGGGKRGTITGMTEKGWLTAKMDDGSEETFGFGLSEFGIDCTEFSGKEGQA